MTDRSPRISENGQERESEHKTPIVVIQQLTKLVFALAMVVLSSLTIRRQRA